MKLPNQASLLRLSDTGLHLEDRSQDLRGKIVKDMSAQEIGEVIDLMIDDTEKRVRFLLVSSGGFMGIGDERFLIPVDAIAKVHGNHIHVSRSREDIAGAPRYDPNVTYSNQNSVDELYAHYGVMPFWAVGYANPSFPYYF